MSITRVRKTICDLEVLQANVPQGSGIFDVYLRCVIRTDRWQYLHGHMIGSLMCVKLLASLCHRLLLLSLRRNTNP